MAEQLTITITNKRGLHARAAAKFVKAVSSFSAEVSVVKRTEDADAENAPVNGASILGLMMLGADPGSTLEISATGSGASDVLAALRELIENKFGEGE